MGATVAAHEEPLPPASVGAGVCDRIVQRQLYMNALPIAAAVVFRGEGGLTVQIANTLWSRFEALWRAEGALLARLQCDTKIAAVLADPEASATFDWRDGGPVEARYFTISVAPLVAMADTGPRALVTLIDRTSEVQTERTMRLEMLSDPLTGLRNRTGFVEALEACFAQEGDHDYAVVTVDLLRFARVNDCVGSMGGDELILTVARRLMSVVRGHDLVARTGANEFAMVVRLVDGPSEVLQIARRVAEVLTRPVRLAAFEIKVDGAIGCALATDCDRDAETLMRHAQMALKQAKVSNQVEVYQPAALAAARRRFTLETELRRAIESESLDMAFQPLISLATGKVTGFEALARWDHPDFGTISPTDFIAVAEESGLIVPLGRWALDRALRTLVAWDVAAGKILPLYIGVNLSAIQVARDDIAGLVSGALRQHKVSGYRLSIELTESAILTDADRAGRILEALKSVDAMVAMDDFGTGFSNLASLQKLPIDTLKIDRSFIGGMLDDPDKVAIVRAILSLAQALGMTTTAEGIETHALAQALAAMGATTGQGWHFAPALTSDAALAFALSSLRPPVCD